MKFGKLHRLSRSEPSYHLSKHAFIISKKGFFIVDLRDIISVPSPVEELVSEVEGEVALHHQLDRLLRARPRHRRPARRPLARRLPRPRARPARRLTRTRLLCKTTRYQNIRMILFILK